MNIVAILMFIIGVPAICYGIWNEDKLIEFEQRVFKRWMVR